LKGGDVVIHYIKIFRVIDGYLIIYSYDDGEYHYLKVNRHQLKDIIDKITMV